MGCVFTTAGEERRGNEMFSETRDYGICDPVRVCRTAGENEYTCASVGKDTAEA
jgi:hypothetical protein